MLMDSTTQCAYVVHHRPHAEPVAREQKRHRLLWFEVRPEVHSSLSIHSRDSRLNILRHFFLVHILSSVQRVHWKLPSLSTNAQLPAEHVANIGAEALELPISFAPRVK